VSIGCIGCGEDEADALGSAADMLAVLGRIETLGNAAPFSVPGVEECDAG